MSSPRLDVDALLRVLTIEEKADLCSGAGFWHTRAIERLGIPALKVSDGPHGLRVQIDGGDHLGIETSEPATCFPPAVTLASSWDTDLAHEVGKAIGREALAAGLSVVLGPGVNIKRSPLCGRNFEYFSEDPHVAAEFGIAWVNGLQATGVGASLKHFAVNNQETDRLRVSADVDERALREIYLAAFEPIVRQAQPRTVMCAYNRVNGVYAAQNAWLLIDVLRNEWGFDGLVVSDWGAVNDPVASVDNGLDLEMPSSGGSSARLIVAAVADGALSVASLDRAVRCLLELINASPDPTHAVRDVNVDVAYHHALARRAAAEGAILLKNENGVLPFRIGGGQRIAVIGEFAQTPRFQGAGSSQVNPTQVDSALDAFDALCDETCVIDFAAGYVVAETTDAESAPDADADADAASARHDLINEAVTVASGADVVVVFVGLPPAWESEGFDRTQMSLPTDQLLLLESLGAVRGDIIVVVVNGGAVTIGDFAEHAGAVLECGLGGQASGSAAVDVLTGAVNPSGKLTETIPIRLRDTPSYLNFPGEDRHARYGEGVFVGYRHFDAVQAPVAFPFGFGLSYTTFAYCDLVVDVLSDGNLDDPALSVGVTVTNTGDCAGAEVAQLYVGHQNAPVARPVRELRGFAKLFLEPSTTQRIDFVVTRRELARWSTRVGAWVFDPGQYEVAIGASSRDLRVVEIVEVPGVARVDPLDENSTLAEWITHPVGHDLLVDTLRSSPLGDLSGLLGDTSLLKMIGPFPLRRLLVMLGGAFSLDDLSNLTASANNE